MAQLQDEQAADAERARRLKIDRALLAELESAGERGGAARTDSEYSTAFRKAGLDIDAIEARRGHRHPTTGGPACSRRRHGPH